MPNGKNPTSIFSAMKLDSRTIEYIARLARLEVAPAEAQALHRDLEVILDHAEGLPEGCGPEDGERRGTITWTGQTP